MTELSAVVDGVSDIGTDIRIVRLRPSPGPVKWVAGQYMELVFQGLPARPYSIASAPQTGILEFHIRKTGHGGVSDHVAAGVQSGDIVAMRGPFGNAVIRSEMRGAPLVLIGGGMGLAPLKAMAEDTLFQYPDRAITLYWGTRSAQELYLADYFHGLCDVYPNFRFIPVAQDQTHQLVGDVVRDSDADFTAAHVFVAGPTAMVRSIVPILLHRGVTADRIHSDDPALAQIIQQTHGA